MITYRCFKELMRADEGLALELLEKVGKGDWQNEEVYYYKSLKDFAYYEITEGWYFASGITLDGDYQGAPDLLDYINLTDLGDDLSNTWDDTSNYLSKDGRVLQSSYGW